MISTKGVETTAGSKILAGYVPVFDATVAARCKAAGLPLIGKTNTDEFAMGSSTENSAYGPSHNPWDPTRVPGGSGGGTAAAVSAGLAPWGLGSDTGGSIKQPSALCGNVGLRPTYGTVSRFGVVAFASSLDQVGPVAKNVRDCARLYSIIAGRDPADSTTVDVPEVELPEGESLKGLRIGVPKEMNEAEGIEPGVTAAVQKAIELARELGAEVGECELPRSVEYGLACYYLIAPAEASSNLARYDGVRYGLRVDADSYDEMVERTRDAGFGDEPKRRIMLGTYALSAGYYEAYYGQAQKVRTVIVREHAAAFERFDVLVSPTSPTVAFKLGEKAADPLAMYLSDLLTIPSCMAGLPGLNIPCGLSDGLPVGLQLIGPQLSENTLFRTGHALERRSASTPFRSGSVAELGTRRRARDPRPAEDADEDVLPLRERLRRRREHADLPGLPRLPRRAAGGEPDRARVDDQARARARLRDRAARGLRAQELLLPGPAEGLSDLTIRSTVLHKRQGASTDARTATTRSGSSARTSRRTRRRRRTSAAAPAGSAAPTTRSSTSTAAARRSSRSSPARTSTPPRTRAASCSCCARRSSSSGSRTRRWRRDAARRRERLRPAGGLVRAAHALRAEEHELVPLRRPGDRRRGGAADRALRVRRRGGAGDLRLRRRDAAR